MDLSLGTATCAENHFSHKFRMPFSLGQIFGSVAINYSCMNAAELDVCLLNTHCDDGDISPPLNIRIDLSPLLSAVWVEKSASISGRAGNPNIGLFISKKKKVMWWVFTRVFLPAVSSTTVCTCSNWKLWKGDLMVRW